MLNKVTLIGNLGADPEIRRTQDGRPIANIRLATNETWRDKATGERKQKTEWHRVVVFNEGLCKVVEQYLAKGSTIYVEGKIKTRKWTDQAGVEKYSTEIVLEQFDAKLVMLGGGGGNGGSGGGEFDDDAPSTRGGGGARRPSRNNDMDDNIPFGPEWR